MMGISVGHVLGMHVYINIYINVYMYIYVHTTYYTSERKKKWVKELQSPPLLPAIQEKQ